MRKFHTILAPTSTWFNKIHIYFIEFECVLHEKDFLLNLLDQSDTS